MKARSDSPRSLLCGAVAPRPSRGPAVGLTREDYARAERYLPWNIKTLAFRTLVQPHFIGTSDRFWYRSATRGGAEFVLFDPARRTRRPAFDHGRLAAALAAASGKACDPKALPFETFEFIGGGKAVRFDFDEARWTCDLKTYACAKAGPAGPAEGELLSPDGRWAAFVKDHDLYVKPAEGGAEIRLTTDGEPFYDYAVEAEQSTTRRHRAPQREEDTARSSSGRPIPGGS